MTRMEPQIDLGLGHYVYALLDPRSSGADRDRVFYVGKGKGNRCWQHSEGAEKLIDFNGKTVPSPKIEIVLDILRRGNQPEVKFVAHDIAEDEAFRIEAILIKLLSLSNLISGHRSEDYWLSYSAIQERYGQAVDREELPRNVLFVSLNRNFLLSEMPENLKMITLGDWASGKLNATKIEYIIGVYTGLMRTFYKVEEKPREIPSTNPKGRFRYRWSGDIATELFNRYQNRSLRGKDRRNNEAILTTFGKGQGCRFSP